MTLDLNVSAMARAYESGKSLAEVASEFGCSAPTVRKRLADAGYEIRPRNRGTVSRLDDAEIVSLYESGLSSIEIGRRIGVTDVTVRNHLHAAGCNVRPGGNQPPEHLKARNLSWLRRHIEGESMWHIAQSDGVPGPVVRQGCKSAALETLRRLGPDVLDTPTAKAAE